MSNARDKANIPALNFSSTGIDDNATSTAITIDSSENVGIGTSSPDSALNISRDNFNSSIQTVPTNYSLTFSNLGSTGEYGNQIGLSNGTNILSSFGFIDEGSAGATGIYFTTGSSSSQTERLRISNIGNVGIGTNSPGSNRLLVEGGNAYIKDHLIIGTGDSSTISSDSSGNPLLFGINLVEKMRISSNGNVAIGTTSGNKQLTLESSGSNCGIRINNSVTGRPVAIGFDDNNDLTIWNNSTNGNIRFYNQTGSGSERMRIDSAGQVLVAKTSDAFAGTVGIGLLNTGNAQFVASGDALLYLNKLTNDGDLVRFYQANSVEGSISVSGSTVSYNGFTGTHWSRFTDNSKPTILRGTVLESLDEMCDWYNLEFDVTTQDDDGNDVTNTVTEIVPHVLTDTQSNGDVITYNHEGTDYQATIVKEDDIKHMKSKVSDTTDAKNVYGVFVAYDEDGEGYNDFYVASVGSFVVRIKANETIAKGDLLQSNGDGTAKVQTDDAVRSSSFAKVLSTTIIETYEDGSYLVPCSLMC